MACENRLPGFKPGPHGQNAVTLPLEPPPPMSPVIRRYVDNPKTLFKEVGERKKEIQLFGFSNSKFFLHSFLLAGHFFRFRHLVAGCQ